jgi:acyl-CoA dehydrogenase
MVFAMHQIQVACIVRHAHNAPFFRDYLRELAERQPLVASATSEVGVGGDLRTSICAVERDGTAFTLHKNAATVSYGERADDILATARRAPDAAAGEQVLVLLRRPDTSLERTTAWDTLGLRGTCSPGFQLSARGSCEQVLPTPFAEIASRTMLPVSHVMWSAVWLGLATGAVSLARAFVRRAARRQPGRAPATSGRLAEVVRLLQGMRSEVHDATDAYERVMDDAVATSGIGFVVRMNNLKVTSSQLVVEIVGQALMICGIEGYRVDSPFGLGRQLRDAYGAPVMVSNDRIRVTNATLLLVQKDD